MAVCQSGGQERGVVCFFARGRQSALNKREINSATKWFVTIPFPVGNEKVINAAVLPKTVSPTKPYTISSENQTFLLI